jgi:hypothetical protein
MNPNYATIVVDPLQSVIDRLKNASAQIIEAKGGENWVDASIELIEAFREARDRHPNNISFPDWLTAKGINFFPAPERAALISFAKDLQITREVLAEAKSRSYRMIWEKYKNRYSNLIKPIMRKRRDYRPRERSYNHLTMKLGEGIVDSLKATSLGRAEELRELVILNRGAESGQLLPVVQKLIADAIAGKDVSAMAIGGKIKPPSLLTAWKTRMAFAWNSATYEEREKLIGYLMDNLGEKNA